MVSHSHTWSWRGELKEVTESAARPLAESCLGTGTSRAEMRFWVSGCGFRRSAFGDLWHQDLSKSFWRASSTGIQEWPRGFRLLESQELLNENMFGFGWPLLSRSVRVRKEPRAGKMSPGLDLLHVESRKQRKLKSGCMARGWRPPACSSRQTQSY